MENFNFNLKCVCEKVSNTLVLSPLQEIVAALTISAVIALIIIVIFKPNR